MSVKHLNHEEFEKIRGMEGVALIDFYADWCGPCRMLAPTIEEIAQARPDVTVGKVNVDEEPELAQEFAVVSIPTVIVLKNGEVAVRMTGARPKAQLLSLLESAVTV